jgi:hypothetical protein
VPKKYGDYGVVVMEKYGDYGIVRKKDSSRCNGPMCGAYERPNLPFSIIVTELDEQNSKNNFQICIFERFLQFL